MPMPPPSNRRFARLRAAGVVGLFTLLPADLAAQPPVVPPPPGPVAQQPAPPPRRSPTFPAYLPALFVVFFIILAAQQKQQQEEEEEVSTHLTDSSAAVEYKIMRSGTAAFRKPEKFRAMLDEEARAGWELFEKLDDGRVRLRRAVSWRERDADLGQDPYRTRVTGGAGLDEAVFAALRHLEAAGTPPAA